MKLHTTIPTTLVALALALASTGIAQEKQERQEKRQGEEAQSGKTSKQDEAWAQMTAMADAAELKLAKAAQEKASSEQVKQHAAKMIQDHQTTSQELKQIAQKADIELKTDLPEAKREMIQEITSKSGAEFDKAYMDHEVAAHRMAVAHFQNGAEFNNDPQLKSFAEKTLPVLQQHLQHVEHSGQQTTGTQPRESTAPATAGSRPSGQPATTAPGQRTTPSVPGSQPSEGRVRTE